VLIPLDDEHVRRGKLVIRTPVRSAQRHQQAIRRVQ